MGERKVPECDIFTTLQPKGLREIEVTVRDETIAPGEVLFCDQLAVGKRGAERILRMVKAATQPPKKRGVDDA